MITHQVVAVARVGAGRPAIDPSHPNRVEARIRADRWWSSVRTHASRPPPATSRSLVAAALKTRHSERVHRPRKPSPMKELRSFEFPAWVMFAWVGWLLIASPILLAIGDRVGALPVAVVVWLVATLVIFVRTWMRFGKKHSIDGS